MRLLNAVIGLLQPLGIAPKTLDADEITQKSFRKTGLTDLGDNFQRAGMEALISSMNNCPVSDFGKFASAGFGVEAMSNRLRLIDYLKKHPEVKDLKIERPVFIVGFPRTGTTLLHNLLALSDDRRGLPFWEIINPVPLSDDPKADLRKRKRRTIWRLALSDFVAPEMKHLHDIHYDTLEECWPLMVSQFTVLNWDMTCKWPAYGEWVLGQDMTRSYQEYKNFLKVMQNRVPDKKLVLKCPDHLWFLDTILDVFPDACIVWTHRNPAESLPSYCSLASLNWRMIYGEFEPKDIGPYIQKRFKEGIERALKVRSRVGEDHFFDVNFTDLKQDPKSVVHAITDHFGLKPVSTDSMNGFLTADRHDSKGRHAYTAAHYGLDEDEIRAYFSEYIDRFRIDC